MKITIATFTLCLFCLLSQAQNKGIYNAALADSLENMAKIDQTAAGVPQGKLKALSKVQWQVYKDSVFNTHQRLLDKMYQQYGYPGYTLVGVKGAHFYWLMVQHSDKQPKFQQKILTAMKKEVDNHNADATDYAYLVDRVNINIGKKQLYGTQVLFDIKICQAYPKPVADSLNLNARRKHINLPPIENYLNDVSEAHFTMNEETYKAKGITGPKLYKVTQ